MAKATPAPHSELVGRALTEKIISCFYRVYDDLGFGFLESVYQRALAYELNAQGLSIQTEAVLQVWYREVRVGCFRADLMVERSVIVEIKASERAIEADRKQLMNYLRCSALEVGLLLHFGPRPSFQRLVYSNTRKPRSSAGS